MAWIKDLSDGLNKLTHIEKVGIFCFTIISIITILKEPPHHLAIILYSFGIMIYFLYLGFHKYERDYAQEDGAKGH